MKGYEYVHRYRADVAILLRLVEPEFIDTLENEYQNVSGAKRNIMKNVNDNLQQRQICY